MKIKYRLLKNGIIFGMFPISFIFFTLSAAFPEAVECLYSRSVYQYIARVQSLFNAPFSLSELIISLFIIFLMSRAILSFVRFVRGKTAFKDFAKKTLKGTFLYCGVVDFLFIFLWGFNYNRKPVAELVDLKEAAASPEHIAACLDALAERSGELAPLVARNVDGIFCLSDTARASVSLQAKACTSIFSKAMSKAGIGGFYFPFTGEANYNSCLPESDIPFTAAHESAHRMGFAKENDANFVAYIMCRESPLADIRYSAELTAVSYLLAALKSADEDLYKEKLPLINQFVKCDIKNKQQFWRSNRGWFMDFSEKWNDIFLKTNFQKDGNKSYGRFAEMLLSLYAAEKL